MFSSQAQENESDNNNSSVDSEQRSPPQAKGRGFIPSTAKPVVEVTIGKVGVEVAESSSSTAKRLLLQKQEVGRRMPKMQTIGLM